MLAQCTRLLALLVSATAAAAGMQLTDAEYHALPALFALDGRAACSSARGLYCLGTFTLHAPLNASAQARQLMLRLQTLAADKHHWDRTRVHRGYCVTSRCARVEGSALPPRELFEQCVQRDVRRELGLHARLQHLDYCESGEGDRPGDAVDVADLAVAGVGAVILVLNLLGTLYDVLRNHDNKPNRYLVSWSLVASWRRLTDTHEGGDPRLLALRPAQGIKALTMICILLAHSVFVYHQAYLNNPMFFEKANTALLSQFLKNGSLIVQTFVVLSSFLLTYNLLLSAARSGSTLGLSMLPQCLLHRLVRITPVTMFWVGVTATWWRRMGSGALWPPLVEAEARRCRDKWWSHALYINNLYRSEEPCLVQTWFLAADTQLYVLSCVVTLLVGRRPRLALVLLPALLVASVIAIFLLSLQLRLQPLVVYMSPESLRVFFRDSPSFKWLYTSCWGSLPASLLGQMLAFLYKHTQDAGYNVAQSKVAGASCAAAVAGMFAWVLGGRAVMDAQAPLVWALYAAIARPVFALLVAATMFGAFHKVGEVWWRFLSWHGWVVLGRMSLSVLLVHWSCNLTLIALTEQTVTASVLDIGCHWLGVLFLSYVTALLLHLGVEVPAQKFLMTLLSR